MTRSRLPSIFIGALLVAAPAAWAGENGQNMTGKQELEMQHCPSAVAGSTTKVSDTADGVEITVTSPKDIIAQQEIRRRVQFQLEIVDAPERGSIEHTGFGTGSGRFGFCPGMAASTSLDVKWLPDGALMIIKADKPEDVKALQRSTHKRAKALAARMHKVASR